MSRITVLPHKRLCPAGVEFEATPGRRLGRLLEAHEVALETACENACACGTCHVIIRAGFETLRPAAEREEDTLDKGPGPSRHIAGSSSCRLG